MNCGPANAFVTDLTGQNVDDVLGLFVDGVRAFRARYPNCNPFTVCGGVVCLVKLAFLLCIVISRVHLFLNRVQYMSISAL